MKTVAAILLFGALALSTPLPAAAREPSTAYSSTFQRCIKNIVSDFDMRECQGAEIERQRKDIAVLIKALNAKYDADNKSRPKNPELDSPEDKYAADDKSRLKNSQRDWLKYQTSECEFESGSEIGGTLWYVVIDDCYMDLGHQRIQILKRMLKVLPNN